MAKKLDTINISSLMDFTEFIETSMTNQEIMWFRGCGKSSYELNPSLFRNNNFTTEEEFLDLESKILVQFQQKSIPYLSKSLNTDWEYLFFMQHFGVPTRLLDWTENPYIALFFALTGASKKLHSTGYSKDAAVWLLNPITWNQTILKHINYTGGILNVDEEFVKGYAPKTDISIMNSEPIAINGTYNSPRIVAQRGVFTIFGKNFLSFEKVFEKLPFDKNTLKKLLIPKDSIEELLKSLIRIGFSDSVIFPDLDGLAKEIKRKFSFEV